MAAFLFVTILFLFVMDQAHVSVKTSRAFSHHIKSHHIIIVLYQQFITTWASADRTAADPGSQPSAQLVAGWGRAAGS